MNKISEFFGLNCEDETLDFRAAMLHQFKLAQPFYWHNPSALPAPIEWVNKRKIRAKTSVNTVWWLCKNPKECKANVKNVLVPYSSRMQNLVEHPENYIKGKSVERPSGHVLTISSLTTNNGGAIPSNLL